MEKLIDQIYSEFDASITITPTTGKTFSETEINWKELYSIKDVKTIAKGREELIDVSGIDGRLTIFWMEVEQLHFSTSPKQCIHEKGVSKRRTN